MIPGLCNLFQSVIGGSGGMTVVVSPSFNNVVGNGSQTTAPFTATPTGGTGPYTYAWSQVSGDLSITIGSPTSATTQFSATITSSDYIVGTFVCQVTDSGALVANSNTVNVAFQGIF